MISSVHPPDQPSSQDRRVARTRAAVMSAFTSLLFERGFDAVTCGDVAARADVGRSTLYKHFRGKEEILGACMSRFFAVFAESVDGGDQPSQILPVLDHLFSNRRLTDAIFTGAARTVLSRSLADLIEARLRAVPMPLHPRLAAIQIAESQLALVEAWLRGKAHASSATIAAALHEASAAHARALHAGLPGLTSKGKPA